MKSVKGPKNGGAHALCSLLLCLILTILSCKKSNQDCEKWLVLDYCEKRCSCVSCDVSGTQFERTICGEDLQLAREGKIKVRYSDNDVVLLTRYIRKIQ